MFNLGVECLVGIKMTCTLSSQTASSAIRSDIPQYVIVWNTHRKFYGTKISKIIDHQLIKHFWSEKKNEKIIKKLELHLKKILEVIIIYELRTI